MAPYCERQIFIVPKIKQNTSEIDANLPFEVCRIKYLEFNWLKGIKSKYFKYLPIAPLINFSFSISALNKCWLLKRQYGLDMVHVHGINFGPTATMWRYLAKIPVVIMIDGSQESYSHLAGIFETMLIKLTNLDHYFVVDNGGPALLKFKRLLHDQSKLTPVFINLDTSKLYPKPKNIELTKRLGLNNCFVFISIHNLEPIQGVEYSILGFKYFIDQYNIKDATLLIVGAGSIKNELEKMASELKLNNRVIFVGAISNSLVIDYYSISDVALSTSLKINMNTSTIEAMACKKPVIAFDCGNTEDLLIRHMQNGILVSPGSIEELSESMFLCYNKKELRISLGENAREFVVNNRDWGKRIDSELGVYNKLLKD